jgi:non-ribosomal peptide synthetase component F
LYTTMLTAWAALLSRLSGQQDVVVGTPAANRSSTETEPLIGFFVNPLAIRVNLSGNPSFAELLGRVKKQVLRARAHADLPFDQVVKVLNPGRSLAYSPVFQVMFAWLNLPEAMQPELHDLQVEFIGASSGTGRWSRTKTGK